MCTLQRYAADCVERYPAYLLRDPYYVDAANANGRDGQARDSGEPALPYHRHREVAPFGSGAILIKLVGINLHGGPGLGGRNPILPSV